MQQIRLVPARLSLFSLYQSGIVQTDCLSKPFFSVERGVRQGDPISPVLFNAALEKLMRKLKEKWTTKRRRVDIGGAQRLQNLRFADDLLLIGSTLGEVRSMLADLIIAAANFGLEIHKTKTKMLWNGFGSKTSLKNVQVEGKTI